MVLESTAWGKLLRIIRLIQFSTVLWLRGWGLDLGKAKTMKSLLYGTSGINRLKASTVYAVIWFFYSLGIGGLGEAFADYTALSALYCVLLFGIDGLGKLLPTIRLCMVCCLNGFFMVLRLRGWDLNLGRPKNGEKPYKRYTPSTISTTSVYGLARRARKDKRARPCNFLALLSSSSLARQARRCIALDFLAIKNSARKARRTM